MTKYESRRTERFFDNEYRKETKMPKDKRIVYGARCTWWDSIDKVSSTAEHPRYQGMKDLGNGLGEVPTGPLRGVPCCPHCGSVLYEIENIDKWNKGADEYEKQGRPGYRKLIDWMRGKCFKSMSMAKLEYEKETGDILPFKFND